MNHVPTFFVKNTYFELRNKKEKKGPGYDRFTGHSIVTIVSCKSPPKEKVKWPEIYSE